MIANNFTVKGSYDIYIRLEGKRLHCIFPCRFSCQKQVLLVLNSEPPITQTSETEISTQ